MKPSDGSKNNQARTARRHRAAARARGVATAALGAPDVQGTTEAQRAEPMELEERFVAQIGSSQSRLQVEPVLTVRVGGARDLSPHVTGASIASVDKAATTQRLRTHARRPPVAGQLPPAVAPPPVVDTLARQSGIHLQAHLNCGGKRPSRTRCQTTSARCPGRTPKSSSARGQ